MADRRRLAGRSAILTAARPAARKNGGVEPVSWTPAQVRARRLDRQLLLAPASGELPAVVSAMCGAHAQVMSAAELSIGLRMKGITKTSVQQALWVDRSLIKTYGPRGTVHLLPAADLPMWTGALSAVPPGNPTPADFSLNQDQADEVVKAIDAALTDHDCMTVDELGSAVITSTGSWAADQVVPAFGGWWPRWRPALAVAGQRGVLCFGPDRGRSVTYTSPASWLPDAPALAHTTALTALVRCYLGSFGPATSAHFAQWLAAPREWAADLFADLADQLTEVDIAGTAGQLSTGDGDPPTKRAGGVRLLPYFDSYVIGGRPREDIYPRPVADRALSRGQAGTVPVVLVNGVVGGVWHHRRAGRTVHITVELLRDLSRRQRSQLSDEVDRTAGILEAKPSVTFGPAPVGRHL